MTSFQPPTIPRDSEGYVKSFPVTSCDDPQAQAARNFFDEYGFVVFSDVFTPEQCQSTIDDIWNTVHSMVQREIRQDETLWDNKIWRATGLVNEGIIGFASLWTRQILLNRQTPNLHSAYATILGTPDLIVNQDRYGLFRPAKNYPERKSQTNLHLDMNPWSYIEDEDNSYQIQVLSKLRYRSDQDWITENNEPGCKAVGELHVQGLVNLADNLEEDGGFWLVPGFHKYLPKWALENKNLVSYHGYRLTFNMFSVDEIPDLYPLACHISSRAGSAILWDQRTLHGSRSNSSLRPRYAQFFKMFPAHHPSMTETRILNRRDGLLNKLKMAHIDPDKDLTELGRKLFGL